LNASRPWSEAELPFQQSKIMAGHCALSTSFIYFAFHLALFLTFPFSVLEQISADKVHHHRRTFVGIFRTIA